MSRLLLILECCLGLCRRATTEEVLQPEQSFNTLPDVLIFDIVSYLNIRTLLSCAILPVPKANRELLLQHT